jgi:hypothetical protein
VHSYGIELRQFRKISQLPPLNSISVKEYALLDESAKGARDRRVESSIPLRAHILP